MTQPPYFGPSSQEFGASYHPLFMTANHSATLDVTLTLTASCLLLPALAIQPQCAPILTTIWRYIKHLRTFLLTYLFNILCCEELNATTVYVCDMCHQIQEEVRLENNTRAYSTRLFHKQAGPSSWDGTGILSGVPLPLSLSALPAKGIADRTVHHSEDRPCFTSVVDNY